MIIHIVREKDLPNFGYVEEEKDIPRGFHLWGRPGHRGLELDLPRRAHHPVRQLPGAPPRPRGDHAEPASRSQGGGAYQEEPSGGGARPGPGGTVGGDRGQGAAENQGAGEGIERGSRGRTRASSPPVLLPCRPRRGSILHCDFRNAAKTYLCFFIAGGTQARLRWTRKIGQVAK